MENIGGKFIPKLLELLRNRSIQKVEPCCVLSTTVVVFSWADTKNNFFFANKKVINLKFNVLKVHQKA